MFSINLLVTCYREREKEAGVLSLRCLLYANVLSNTLFTQWVSHRFWYSSRGGLIPLTHDQSVAANYRRVLTLRELQRTIRGNNRGKLIGANGIAKRGTREERKGVKARLQSLHSLEFVQSIGRYIYRSRDYYVERLVHFNWMIWTWFEKCDDTLIRKIGVQNVYKFLKRVPATYSVKIHVDNYNFCTHSLLIVYTTNKTWFAIAK